MQDKSFNFKKSIKSLANIDDRVTVIIGKYKLDKEIELEHRKIVINILKGVRNFILDFNALCETTLETTIL